MALFGDPMDINFFNSINDELLENIIEQEILYYKLNGGMSDVNIYGESLDKYYHEPVIFNPLVSRNPQQNTHSKPGVDNNRIIEFRLYKNHLISKNMYCEKGDIVEWHNEFYEIDDIIEDQFFMGKANQDTSVVNNTLPFGYSVSILLKGVLIRPEKINIISAS